MEQMSLRHRVMSLNATQPPFGGWVNSGCVVEGLSSLDLRVPYWDVDTITHFSFALGLTLGLGLGE